VPYLAGELRQLADDGARCAQPRPAADLIRRADRRRRRRAVRGSVAGLSVAGAIAAGVIIATGPRTAGHQVAASQVNGPRISAHLTAWTVSRQSDGDVTVTFHQLLDPAGVQSTLRADGIPATVTFSIPTNPACLPYTGKDAGTVLRRIATVHDQSAPDFSLVIHPAALPSGAGVALGADPGTGGLLVGLVATSPRCTGS